MTVAYVFADPERAVVDRLDAQLAEPVGTFYPRSSMEAPVVPFVQVGWDGTPSVRYPVTQRATVRVTVWHTQPTAAKALAARVQALMLSWLGDDDVWAVQALTGPLPTRDPTTGHILVSATYRVSVRPTPLTV